MSDFSGRTSKKLDVAIANIAFWPALNLGEIQEEYRVPSEYRADTIQTQLLTAISEVNRMLKPFRDLAMGVFESHEMPFPEHPQLHWLAEAEYLTLADVPAEKLAGLHELVELYKTAVYSRATSKVWGIYATANRRDQQTHNSREAEETELSFLCASDDAVKLIMGDVPTYATRGAAV